MALPEVIFDQLTLGRLPSEITSDFTSLVRPLQVDIEYMKHQLSTTCADVFRDIYVDIVDDRSLNALAFMYDSQEFVGINAGVGVSLPFIFLSLLSQPDVLPTIGDATAEVKRPMSLDSFLRSTGKASVLTFADFPSSSMLYPRSELRYHHAVFLSSRALAFLLNHEVGHIIRCHLPYMRDVGLLTQETSGALALTEFSHNVGDVQAIRRVLEFDADSMASRNQVEGILSQSLSEHANLTFGPDCSVELKWEDVAYLWLVSVGVLFQLFAILDKSSIDDATLTHPNPDLRFFVLANFAWSSWNKVISNASSYSAIAKQARNDLWGIWHTLGLPISNARESPTYDADFRNAHIAFQQSFERVAEPLNKLSMQRIK